MWHCDACNEDHAENVESATTETGALYCDKWEPVTVESVTAEIEAYFDAMISMQEPTD